MDEPQDQAASSAASQGANRAEACKQAESKLCRTGYLALQRLSCEFRSGVLTVRGRLPSYYLKQIALLVLATVEGVQFIDDQVEVSARASIAKKGT